MPSSTVEHHHQAIIRKCLGGFDQEPSHGFSVGLLLDGGDEAAISRRDGAEQVKGFADQLLGTGRPDLSRNPVTIEFADPPEPGLVSKEQAQALAIFQRFPLFFRDFREVFLKGSTAAGSRLG